MTVRPSETRHGSLWLANFKSDERRAAILLIDSLSVISSNYFRVILTDSLRETLDKLPKPVAVYAARELPKLKSDSFPPLDHPFDATPGSEAIIGNIIREAVGRRPRGDRAASFKALDALRSRKVRTLLLVDDYSGTGDQIIKYVDEWMAHPTIKSWHSYRLLRIHVMLVAASGQARRRLESHRFVSGLHCIEPRGDFDSAPWTAEERCEIESLCRKYAHKAEFETGYRDSRGLLLFHHTVPNNLPHILWQNKCSRLKGWVPLFESRAVPPQFQKEVGDYRLETDPIRIASIIEQQRLGSALASEHNPTVRILLLVLGALEKGYRDPMKLANLLGITIKSVQQTLEACQMLHLADSNYRLSDEGRRELRQARRRVPAAQTDTGGCGNDAPYYPVSLRGAE